MEYKTVTHSLDPESIQLLSEIAKAEADNEKPNESRSLRKMIREKAAALSISVKTKKQSETTSVK